MMIMGAIKIVDGLFIGDEVASKDLQFIVSNKVTHIVNCSAKQLPNSFEQFGVKYLKFYWLENDQQVLFDMNTATEIYKFIESAHRNGESALIHSIRGQSRSCCALAAFFMRKYKWKLYKTLEFLNSKRPDLEIRASFYHQLTQLEQRLCKKFQGGMSSSWNTTEEQELPLEQDEKLLRNTYLNSKQSPPADCWLDKKLYQHYLLDKKPRTITWADEQLQKQQQKKNHLSKPIIKQQQQQQQQQQSVIDKVSNINGNIFHVTVNNFLTVKDEEKSKQIALEQQKRENSQLMKGVNSNTIKRQQNDSLKKHLESKNQNYGKSKSTKNQKKEPSIDERPRSAVVHPPTNPLDFTSQKPQQHLRQFSPLVKSSAPKPTQLIPTNKNKGWRYPSPAQITREDSFLQSIINSKPIWK